MSVSVRESLNEPTSTVTHTPVMHTPIKPSFIQRVKQIIIKQWFLIGIGIVIGLAFAYPPLGRNGGYIHSEITVKYVVVGLIFFLSGLSLKTYILLTEAKHWKVHLMAQGLSLGIFPLVGWGVGSLLKLSSFNRDLADGLIIACATPTTIASNVLFTRQAGGNEVAALFNAVLGNIIGVFISPSLISAYVGSIYSSSFNYSQVFIDLAISVIGPLILGQLVQIFLRKQVEYVQTRVSFPIVSSLLLLVLVWSVFCNMFSSDAVKQLDAGSLVSVVAIDVTLFLLFTATSFGLTSIPVLKYDKGDIVAIGFCSATKTVALGIPMINIIYGSTAKVGVLSIPLLIYHAQQLVVGTMLIARVKTWMTPPKAYSLEGVRVEPTDTLASCTATSEAKHLEEHDSTIDLQRQTSQEELLGADRH